jgi:hypothetical protein
LEDGISEVETLVLVLPLFEIELVLVVNKREVGAESVGDPGSHGPYDGGLSEDDDASTTTGKIELPDPRARRWAEVSVSDGVVSRADMLGLLGQSRIPSGSIGKLIINHHLDNVGVNAGSRDMTIVIGFTFSQCFSWKLSAYDAKVQDAQLKAFAREQLGGTI